MTAISDKTKIVIDPKGAPIDLLDSNEYVSFLVRSTEKDIYEHMMLQCRFLGLGRKDITFEKKKAANLLFAYMHDKHIAEGLLDRTKRYLKGRGIAGRLDLMQQRLYSA